MKTVKQILLPLAAALLVTAIIGAGVLKRLDRWAQDALLQSRGVTSRNIVIIGIDEEALDLFGPYNNWDRSVMAAALEALAADPEKKPAVTAIDVLYAGDGDAESDARLAEAAETLGNVITASVATLEDQIVWADGRAAAKNTAAVVDYALPYEALRERTTQGHINAMVDSDGVLRHALLYVEPNGERVYSMATETARRYLEQRGQALELPPDRGMGHFYVPFTGLPGNYSDGVSIAWLIQGKVPADYWAGKIVLIGPYAPALQDAYFTSIEKGRQMYGVEFQANVIQSLVEGNFKAEAPDRPQLAALLALCAALALLFRRVKVGTGRGNHVGCQNKRCNPYTLLFLR